MSLFNTSNFSSEQIILSKIFGFSGLKFKLLIIVSGNFDGWIDKKSLWGKVK